MAARVVRPPLFAARRGRDRVRQAGVAEVADDVVVMNRAKVVEHGPAVDIFENPAEPYTQVLLASVPRLGSMQGRSDPAPFELVEYDS